MKNISITTIVLSVVLGLFLGCEDDQEIDSLHPLVGSYSLDAFTVHLIGESQVDTNAVFLTPVGNTSETLINVGDLVVNNTTVYTTDDANPISGTIILDDEGYATLTGALPMNIGTKCDPLIFIQQLGPIIGEWEAGIEDNSFNIEMTIEQLDIHGFYEFDSTANSLTVVYTETNLADTLGLSAILYEDTLRTINKICLPVITTTERTMELLVQD